MKLKPIKDKKKIDAIFNKGMFIGGQRLSIKYLKFNSGGGRYGISVSKKIFPLAVTRNLIKRRIRSQLRSLDLTNIASNNVSFFLIFSNNGEIPKSTDLIVDIENLLEKVEIEVKPVFKRR